MLAVKKINSQAVVFKRRAVCATDNYSQHPDVVLERLLCVHQTEAPLYVHEHLQSALV